MSAGRQDLCERFLEFGALVVSVVESLPNSYAGRKIGEQLLRSGTSAGANYEEAQAAESKADFTHKLQIALKEIREAYYWLRLIEKVKMISENRLKAILDETRQLRALLSKAVATAKGKAK